MSSEICTILQPSKNVHAMHLRWSDQPRNGVAGSPQIPGRATKRPPASGCSRSSSSERPASSTTSTCFPTPGALPPRQPSITPPPLACIAAGPGLFTEVRSAHEPLVRFFEPRPARRPQRDRPAERRPPSGRRIACDRSPAATNGRVTRAEFAVAFERAFASVSQEIFAARWAGMSPIDRQVVPSSPGATRDVGPGRTAEGSSGGTGCS